MRGHILLLGLPGTGKTTLARQLSAAPRARGRLVVALDPKGGAAWRPGADYVTADPELWLRWMREGWNLEGVIDDAFAVRKKMPDLGTFAILCSDRGHRLYIGAHKATSIEPHVRIACEHLFAFNQEGDDATDLARNYGIPRLAELVQFPDYHGLWIMRGRPGVEEFTTHEAHKARTRAA